MRVIKPGLLVVFAAACGGGGAFSPGVGDDPGSGTSTLFVDADVDARPIVPNARESTDFTTEFHVRLEKAGVAVTTGTVTITSGAGEVPLIYRTDSNRWHGVQVGYFEVYELSAVSGSDDVTGVRVDGPALHTITAPALGATVDSTMPLTVTWDRDEQADQASIETEEIDALAIADTGSHVLPPGSLKDNQDQTEQERIRIDRSQRVTPAGAVAGSAMRVEIRNEVEILVQPTGP